MTLVVHRRGASSDIDSSYPNTNLPCSFDSDPRYLLDQMSYGTEAVSSIEQTFENTPGGFNLGLRFGMAKTYFFRPGPYGNLYALNPEKSNNKHEIEGWRGGVRAAKGAPFPPPVTGKQFRFVRE